MLILITKTPVEMIRNCSLGLEFARNKSVNNSLMNRSAIGGYMTHIVLDTAKSRAGYYV